MKSAGNLVQSTELCVHRTHLQQPARQYDNDQRSKRWKLEFWVFSGGIVVYGRLTLVRVSSSAPDARQPFFWTCNMKRRREDLRTGHGEVLMVVSEQAALQRKLAIVLHSLEIGGAWDE